MRKEHFLNKLEHLKTYSLAIFTVMMTILTEHLTKEEVAQLKKHQTRASTRHHQ